MPALDGGQQRVSGVLVPVVDDEVGADPAVADAGLGHGLRHLGVDVDRPGAQVVDQLLLLGELERIDVVARVRRSALPFDRLAGLVVVAAAGVGGHRAHPNAPPAVYFRSPVRGSGPGLQHHARSTSKEATMVKKIRRRTATAWLARVATVQPMEVRGRADHCRRPGRLAVGVVARAGFQLGAVVSLMNRS